MKKFIRIFGISVLLIVVAMLVLPFVFKGKIQTAIRDAANENLTAVLDFSDISLSLFTNFPNLTVRIHDLSLTGTEVFDGVKLIEATEVRATIDLSSLFGETIELREIFVDQMGVDVRVLADGQANYDIMKPSTEETAAEPEPSGEESSPFAMKLRAYAINNATIRYDDATYPMRLEIDQLNHSGKGDFTLDLFTLTTQTTLERLDVVYDGVRYIRNAKADLKADLEIDNTASRYTFKDNVLLLNQLPLRADGWVLMPNDAIDMDIQFSSTGGDLIHLLSMVPAEFASDLEGVSASGSMDFNGFVRGTYDDTRMPGFALNLNVENGRFNYPDLPESVEKIDIKMRIDASEGIESDAMTIDIDKFYMELAKNPINLTFHLKNPYTDPLIDCELLAKVNFASLKDVVPMEAGDELSGSMQADLRVKGRMSAIDEERYDDFHADGNLSILDTQFKSDSLPYDMAVHSANFTFNPRFAELTNFDAQLGRSDLKASGKITNYMAYALRDSLLTGNFTVSSSLLDLNEFMTEDEAAPEVEEAADSAAADSSSMSKIVLPGNVDFTLAARFDRMLYDNLEINNTRGTIVLRDQVARLVDLNLELIGGNIGMNGTYDSRPDEPLVAMDFAMRNIDIQEAAEKFVTLEKLAPIAKSCTGRFSTTMRLDCALDATMMPIETTISGGGKLQTTQVNVEKFEPLNKLAQELGIERLAKQSIRDVNVTYRFVNGRVEVDPFTIALEGISTTIDGSMSFSQELDYNVKMTIPTNLLPGNLSGAASSLLSDLNQRFGSNLSVGSKIPVMLKVTGTVTDPKVSGNYGDQIKEQTQGVKEQVKEAVKEAVGEKIDEAREAAIAKAREEAQKMRDEARKQADKLMADAKKVADSAKAAAYQEAKKVEDSAKNPLEKAGKRIAADKVRQEADKAHAKSLEAARKQADKLIAEADAKAQSTIDKAEKE